MAPIADNLANDALEEVESRLDTLAQSMPDNVPAHLREYLAKQQQLVQDSLRRERRKKAVQTATAALQGRGDAQQAWTGLEGIAGDAEVDRLRRELRLKTVADTARQRLVVIRSTLDKAKTCDDDELRRIAVTRAYDAAAGVLLDLMIEVPSSTTTIAEARSVVATCREEITKAANRQRAVTEKRLREYQAWALKQIRAFDGPEGWQYDITLAWVGKQLLDFKSAEKPVDWPLLQKFPSVRPLLEKTLELDLSDVKGSLLAAEKQKEIYNAAYARIGWKGNIDQEIAYRTTRDGIVTFLLPINPALLDPPVAQLYQKAFTKAWEKLDSRSADQLYVAEQTAVVPKRGIE